MLAHVLFPAGVDEKEGGDVGSAEEDLPVFGFLVLWDLVVKIIGVMIVLFAYCLQGKIVVERAVDVADKDSNHRDDADQFTAIVEQGRIKDRGKAPNGDRVSEDAIYLIVAGQTDFSDSWSVKIVDTCVIGCFISPDTDLSHTVKAKISCQAGHR